MAAGLNQVRGLWAAQDRPDAKDKSDMSETNGGGLWNAVRLRLQAEIAPNAFDFFIKPLTAMNDSGEDLVLGAPTTAVVVGVGPPPGVHASTSVIRE